MEYLNLMLGIRVVYHDTTPICIPNYIDERYRLRSVTLDGQDAVFLYPLTELDSINAIIKHFNRIETVVGAPAVLIPDHLTYRQREYLLREHIPFIVEGKQIYLPFLAVYLQERCDGERQISDKMLPSAQMLLLCYIYQGCGELPFRIASQKLNLTSTSISRAARQLQEMNLIRLKKKGVQKILFSEQTPEEVFNAANPYFRNPVKRTVYVPKAEIRKQLLFSGYSALAEYSLLNHPTVQTFAVDSVAVWNAVLSKSLQDEKEQCAIELWRYNPKKLSNEACVDRLSLALSLCSDRDERTEEAVEEMLEQVWRDIDGKRD